jgi:hypothetical protein
MAHMSNPSLLAILSIVSDVIFSFPSLYFSLLCPQHILHLLRLGQMILRLVAYLLINFLGQMAQGKMDGKLDEFFRFLEA